MFRRPPYAGSPLSGAITVESGFLPFDVFFDSHRAAVAMFTSATCVQCRTMEPVFEVLAWEKKGRDKVEFFRVDVDLVLSLRPALLRQCGIIMTPTFRFFLDGKKVRMRFGLLSSPPSLALSLVVFNPPAEEYHLTRADS